MKKEKLQGTVLLINFQNRQQREEIEDILRRAQIEIREVRREEYGQSVGALAGIGALYREENQYTGQDFAKEMLVFAGLSEEKLDEVLEQMKARKVRPVDYKAVMTPYNLGWTIAKLYGELSKEHRAMHSQQ